MNLYSKVRLYLKLFSRVAASNASSCEAVNENNNYGKKDIIKSKSRYHFCAKIDSTTCYRSLGSVFSLLNETRSISGAITIIVNVIYAYYKKHRIIRVMFIFIQSRIL